MSIIRRNHGRGHTYEVDGRKLPGVTQILKMRPNDALIGWAGRATAEYAVDNWDALAGLRYSERLKILTYARNEDRDAAAGRGTHVHRIAERLVMGEQVEKPEPIAGHIDSYRDFLDRLDVQPVAVELVLANRETGYCGTADLVADLPALMHEGGKIPAARWLLDIKTARSGIFPDTALQVCAYARAEVYADGEKERAVRDLGIERTGAVHVRADGWDLRPTDNGEETWETFRHLAWLHYHAGAADDWVGPAVDPPPAPLMALTGELSRERGSGSVSCLIPCRHPRTPSYPSRFP